MLTDTSSNDRQHRWSQKLRLARANSKLQYQKKGESMHTQQTTIPEGRERVCARSKLQYQRKGELQAHNPEKGLSG